MQNKKTIKILITILIIAVPTCMTSIYGFIANQNSTIGNTNKISAESVSDNMYQPETKTMTPVKQNPQEYRHFDNYIWAGDSRTVGLASDCGISEDFILAKEGMGLDWCKNNIAYLNSTKECNIVFNFGVNDLENVHDYVDFYNNLPDEFLTNNQIFIMSVNPVNETAESKHGYSVTNANIDEFNNILYKSLRKEICYLDTNSYLKNTGFGTQDGLHYDTKTYQKLLTYTVDIITNGANID